METVLELYESKSINNRFKKHIKLIRKNKIDVNSIINNIKSKLEDKYNITVNDTEIFIKIDKRKNIEEVKKEIEGILNKFNFDTRFLLRITTIPNTVVIKVRRK
jgi:polyribonucleotide nucleotidyltransferase